MGGESFSPPHIFRPWGGNHPPMISTHAGGIFRFPPHIMGGESKTQNVLDGGELILDPTPPHLETSWGGKSLTPPHISLLPPIYEGGIAKIWGGVAKFCLLPPIILGGESKTQNVLDGGELILNPTPPHILRPWGGNILLPPHILRPWGGNPKVTPPHRMGGECHLWRDRGQGSEFR